MTRRLLFLLVLFGTSVRAAWGDDWPRFRGPTGQGLCAEADLPLRWGSTENVAWNVAVPHLGHASPVGFNLDSVWAIALIVTAFVALLV